MIFRYKEGIAGYLGSLAFMFWNLSHSLTYEMRAPKGLNKIK